MTELVAAIAHCKRFHLRQKLPAREGIEEPFGLHLRVVEPDQISHFRGMGQELRCGGFDGQGGRIACAQDLARRTTPRVLGRLVREGFAG